MEEGREDGSLPNLRSARAEGAWGTVHSNADYFPASVWPTFFTLSNVSEHGVYHALQWDRQTRRFRMPGPLWLETKPFWAGLAAEGVPVITLDVPFAAAAARPKGVTEVLGWGTNESMWSVSRPAGLLHELNRRHGPSSVAREVPGPRDDVALAFELDALVADVGRRTDIILDLANRFDWQLMVACYTETHHAGHWYWGDRVTGEPRGGIKRVLRAIDAGIPRLRGLLRPDDHLAIFSTHGMGPRYHAERFGDSLRSYFDPSGEMSLRRLADPVRALRSLLPIGARRFLARALPKGAYNQLVVHDQNASRAWSRSVVVINPLDQVFYVTVNSGDDAGGSIKRLVAEFEAMRTEEGWPAVESIVRPTEIYAGERLEVLPDLVVRMAPFPLDAELVTARGTILRGAQRTWQDGDHTPDGFYLQVGPGIRPATQGPDLPVEDLAPWLCYPAGIVLGAGDRPRPASGL